MSKLILTFALAASLLPAYAYAHAAPSAQSQTPAGAPAAAGQQTPAPGNVGIVTQYTLPPDLYRKAHLLGQISFWAHLVGTLYGWIVLLLILNWKLAPKFRNWASPQWRVNAGASSAPPALDRRGDKPTSAKFREVIVFAPPLLLSIAILTIPLDIVGEWVERKFGLSIQGWASWSWDWVKAEIVSLIIGTILVWILYAVIRHSPRRWWFYFWLASLPIIVFLVFAEPLVIDPLFHKFEPLAQKDPALTVSLERMIQHAGENIPPERMFWMNAGEKTTALDAYVTGLGASKRIVVFDTTIAKMNTPQIVYVAGHEMGHYVLNHIWKGLAFAAVGLFIIFYLGFRTIGWLLSRCGAKWDIHGLEDWASLPALLLLVSIFSFIGSPIGSAFSRHIEHQADQFGLEVTYGLTPDSNQIAAQSFQILGQVDLADPAPNPVAVFLFYSHPPIPDRIHFALTYDASHPSLLKRPGD
jgi:STE24 endopeptidase